MGVYTYQDFEKKANEYGLSGQISEADLKLAKENPDAGIAILNAKNDYKLATTDEGRALANAKAEETRRQFGSYTGGTAGSDFNPVKNTPSSFTSTEGIKAGEKLNEYINYKPYSYDPESDSVYSAYKKAYQREGERASEDTMAQAAAMTGGIPSSYAVTASQQAGNYYASQLADKVPELEAQAYNRYQNDKTDLLNAYQLLMNADQNKYDRNLDQIDYEQKEKENKWYEEEVKRKKDDTDYNRRVTDAYLGLEVGDYSPLKKLKLTPDLEKINSTGNYFENLRESYGYGLPSNIWDSALSSGYSNEDLVNAGFNRELTELQKDGLIKAYPEGTIPSDEWADLLSNGYRIEDLENLGLSKDPRQVIDTPYYHGYISDDAKNGTFTNTLDSNGIPYQPNNIGGTKLEAVEGMEYTFTDEFGNPKTQKVWRKEGSDDDTLYVWDGENQTYKVYTPQK